MIYQTGSSFFSLVNWLINVFGNKHISKLIWLLVSIWKNMRSSVGIIDPLLKTTHIWFLISTRHTYGGFLKWGYPQIIHFHGIFHFIPSILGYLHLWKPPYIAMNWIPTLNPQSRSPHMFETARSSCVISPSYPHWIHGGISGVPSTWSLVRACTTWPAREDESWRKAVTNCHWPAMSRLASPSQGSFTGTSNLCLMVVYYGLMLLWGKLMLIGVKPATKIWRKKSNRWLFNWGALTQPLLWDYLRKWGQGIQPTGTAGCWTPNICSVRWSSGGSLGEIRRRGRCPSYQLRHEIHT